MKRVQCIVILLLAVVVVMMSGIRTFAQSRETRISVTAYMACVEFGTGYRICPELLMAVIEKESGGDPDAVGGQCIGLMQINPRWHGDRMHRLGVDDLHDERGNILVGADYLAELFERYQEAELVLMIYHGERNAVQKVESGEVSEYAAAILERTAELERLHEKEGGVGE